MDNMNQYYTFIDMEAMFTYLFEGETSNKENVRLQMISNTYFTMILHIYIVLSIP